MALQSLLVALIVAACAVYAAWALLPSGARRHVARATLRLRLPAALAAPLQRALQRGGGCVCDGCEHGAARAPAATTQPLRFHPRIRR